MTILEVLVPSIFGLAFDGATWRAWVVFLAACFGLNMTEEQVTTYRHHTGRRTPPREAAREVWCIAGRRAGKSRIAALLAVYVAVFLHDFARLLAPGERAVIAVIACDRAQAAVVFRYVSALLDAVPMLRRLIVRQTQSSVELANGAVIEITTCSHRSTRGYTFACVIADELAFWRSETSAEPDVEVLNAVRPGLATIPGSMLIAISSPYSRRGALWQAYKDHYGKEAAPVLVWQSDTASMNPSVAPAIIAAAYAADPAAAAAEYGGQFRADLETFVSREVVDACIVPGRHELPPIAGASYVGFTDPSGGSADSFALAIAHAEGDRLVLDVLREVKPPFSPSAVVAVYAALLPALNSHRVELLDVPRLHAQLLGLERRTARGGRDTIDHAPGAHDDLVNAAAGAVVAAIGPSEPAFLTYLREYVEALQRGEDPLAAAQKPEPVAPEPGIRDVMVPDPNAPDELERRRQGYAALERAARRGAGIRVA